MHGCLLHEILKIQSNLTEMESLERQNIIPTYTVQLNQCMPTLQEHLRNIANSNRIRFPLLYAVLAECTQLSATPTTELPLIVFYSQGAYAISLHTWKLHLPAVTQYSVKLQSWSSLTGRKRRFDGMFSMIDLQGQHVCPYIYVYT